MFDLFKKKLGDVIESISKTVTEKKLSEKDVEGILWDLEIMLLENNVAQEVASELCNEVKKNLVGKEVKRSQIKDIVKNSLKEKLISIMNVPGIDLVKLARDKKPLKIAFVGYNGSGKTTTLAKVAKYFIDNKMVPVLAASDTFRAASIEQLEKHGERLGVKVIKHNYNSDSAAVAFDAIEHAKANKKDVVLIDTAGRLHTDQNLMDELKKIKKVAQPDVTLFIGDAMTGNDIITQAKEFDRIVGIDGIILTKTDLDEKGGAAISISHITKKPILFAGQGQDYADLAKFDPGKVVEMLFQ